MVDPCDAPGTLCTWLGVPEQARVGDEGTDRLEMWTNLPLDVAFAADGSAAYPDFDNHRVRWVDGDDLVWTAAGTGFLGDGDGSRAGCWSGCDALASGLNHPSDVVPDPADPDVWWVALADNARIARVDLAGPTLTWWAGTGERGHADGPGPDAAFDFPVSLAAADDGTIYVWDTGNHVIRRIAPDGVVDLLAGEPGVPGADGDGGPAADAHLGGCDVIFAGCRGLPAGLALDGDTLWVADPHNRVLRAIDLVTGTIDRVAGTYGATASAGDGGPALDAGFAALSDVAVGPDGALYLADEACVRVVVSGTVETFAGTCGVPGFAGDGGPALGAQLSEVLGVAVGPDGAVYVADVTNHVIRRIPTVLSVEDDDGEA
jgi:hypothetical protein